MDATSGEPWSKMDIADLANSLAYGDTFAATASFLCRDEDEVRQKARHGQGTDPYEQNTQQWGADREEGILAPVRIVLDSAYAP
jgi:hypothetical protein